MMRVYVNWETQEVVGGHQAEEVIERKRQEYESEEDLFNDFLFENYTVEQVWRMTEADREAVLEKFSDRMHEEAEDWFNDEFCEYIVE